MATFYVRADGTATKANAVGPETDASKCMTVTTHNAATFAADDNITCSGLGGTDTIKLVPPSSGTSGHPITYTGTYGFTIDNNVDFDIRVNAKNYLTFNRITWTTKYASIIGASVGIIFNQCVGKASTSVYAMNIAGGSTVTVNNSVFHSNANAAIETTDTGNTITLRNNLVYGNNDDNAAIRIVDGNTVDYDYNLVIGNIYRSGALTANVIVPSGSDGGHNVTAYSPKVNGWRNGTAYFVLTVDDQVGISYAVDIANATGVRGTIYPQTAGLTAQHQTDLQTLFSKKWEIGVHTDSHAPLSASEAFAITTTNASPTCDIDVATTTITLATTTPGNAVTLDWTGNKTISDLKTAVAGKGWTITNTTNVQNALRLSSLADSSGAQAVPYSPALDKTANGMYYQNEISYPRTVIAGITGENPTTASYPFGLYDSGAATYMQSVEGLDGCRDTILGSHTLSAVNIFRIWGTTLTDVKGDGTEATIRQLANHYFTWAKETGAVAAFLAHEPSEFSINQWIWFVDEIKNLGGEWIRFNDAIALIKADHSTADSLTYTKTYSDLSNYRLEAESMAIDAGTVVIGITTDLDGQAIPYSSAPDIGLYEHHDSFVYGEGRLKSGTGMTTVTRP